MPIIASMTKKSKTLIIHNIGQLVTFEPLAKANRLHNIKESDLGIKINSFLQIEKGKLVNSGEGKPPSVKGAKKIDAKGALVLPGLVDSHTHPVFGGTRCEEYAMKLSGKTYQEIADRGGGIESTVKATRATSEKELIERVYGQFKRWLTLGVTTFEVKSGYGLSVKEELRQLKVINKLKKKTPHHVKSTCLA